MSRYGIDPETGLPYPKLQLYVATEVPYLIRRAAEQAGFPHSTLWVRDRMARLLADELEGESYDEIMADMPPSWHQRPGFIALGQAEKSSVHGGAGV